MEEAHSRMKADGHELKQGSFQLGVCKGTFFFVCVIQAAQWGRVGSVLGGLQDQNSKAI